jgi:hypothetical protein
MEIVRMRKKERQTDSEREWRQQYSTGYLSV